MSSKSFLDTNRNGYRDNYVIMLFQGEGCEDTVNASKARKHGVNHSHLVRATCDMNQLFHSVITHIFFICQVGILHGIMYIHHRLLNL